MGMIGPGFVVAVAIAAIIPVLLIISARAPVSRHRVAKFARRQQLEITPGNGERVICYLATTRRWRVAGLLTAYLLSLIGLAIRADQLNLGVLQLLAAWFIGAVIAEARLAKRPVGVQRSASLVPREPAGYLSWSARLAMPVALAGSLLVGGLTLVVVAAGLTIEIRPATVGFAAAILVAATVWAVRRRVLSRHQPADLPPDQLAADDAIRSRSLHVLAGAGVALVLYAVGYQLDALAADPPDGGAFGTLVLFRISLVVLAPVLGWLIATTSWAVERPAAQPTQPA